MISKKMENMVANSSAIRAMFEEGNRLAKIYGSENVFDFSLGNPNVPAPKAVKDAILSILDEEDPIVLHGYTNSNAGYEDVRQAVAESLNERFQTSFSARNITMTVGAAGGLNVILKALLNPGDEVIIPAPYWLTYPEIVKLCDSVPVVIYGTKETGYKVTAKQIEDAVTDSTKALILNTPSNPTGMVYTEEELRAIADVAVRNDFYVVADEMYEYLIYGEKKHVSIASLGEEIYRRTITCSGLSKSYSMTGWRIGYTGSSVEIAKLMGSIQSHQTSNPNSIAQKAALEALSGPQDAVEAMRKEFDARRKYMYERVQNMPLLECLEPEGAFYTFVDFTNVLEKSYKGVRIGTASRAAEILIEDYSVAVVPCQDFGFDNFVRLSYAISMEGIEKGLNRIEDFVTSL